MQHHVCCVVQASSIASSQELEDVKGCLETAEAAAQELASVKEQMTGVSRERDEQAAGRHQAQQQSQQLHKSLQEQEDIVKNTKEELRQHTEQSRLEIELLLTECAQAFDKTTGEPFFCCKLETSPRRSPTNAPTPPPTHPPTTHY